LVFICLPALKDNFLKEKLRSCMKKGLGSLQPVTLFQGCSTHPRRYW
jgi:hypothetical protein